VKILEPLYYAVSWIMVQFHSLFTSMGFDPAGGWAWGLSIVGLVVVIRILLIPLFVKQIHAQRGLQMLQPEIKKIQEKHKNDRERQSQELMKLYKETGTNPLASCLPIIAQAPIFIALFRVLNKVGHHEAIGAMSAQLSEQAANATILGAPISARFIGADSLNVKLVTAGMIVLMSATTFITQKQLMTKNMPASAMNNPFAQQQKILLYVFPLVFAVSGVNFPIGVLLYWLTTNVWSMGQQFYVIRRMPAPGSAAERAYEERQRKRGKTIKKLHIPGLGDTTTDQPDVQDALPEAPKTGQRQQPKGKKRSKRGPTGGPGTGASADGSTGAESVATNGSSAPPTPAPPQDAPQDAPVAANGSGGSNAPGAPGGSSRSNGQRQQPKRQKKPNSQRPKQPQGQVKREGNAPTPDPA
jgi:YidC/Oxa1 family membrane protein insertase